MLLRRGWNVASFERESELEEDDLKLENDGVGSLLLIVGLARNLFVWGKARNEEWFRERLVRCGQVRPLSS